jgi:hypothetical protein
MSELHSFRVKITHFNAQAGSVVVNLRANNFSGYEQPLINGLQLVKTQ